MGFRMGHFELLFFQDVVSVYSVHDLVFGSINPVANERTAFFFIEGFIGKQIFHDACGRKAKGICKDTVDTDAGNGHAVLVTVLLSSVHIRKFQPVTGEFTQSPDISRRDKRGFDDIKTEQVSDPFCVTFVNLFSP